MDVFTLRRHFVLLLYYFFSSFPFSLFSFLSFFFPSRSLGPGNQIHRRRHAVAWPKGTPTAPMARWVRIYVLSPPHDRDLVLFARLISSTAADRYSLACPLSLSLSLFALTASALGLTRAFRAPIARNACTVSTPSPRFRIRALPPLRVCLVFSNSLGNEIAISSSERVRNEREIRILRCHRPPPSLSLFSPLPTS